jgi:FSR family fosmidomycin resistance protein-like MFS transporter
MLSLALAAATRQYWVMFVPFALHTLGSGAFHPVGAMYAAESDEDYAASNLSIFFLLGQSGLALGPALAGFLLDGATGGAEDAVNLAPIFALSLAAIPGVLAMFLAIPSALKRHQAEQEEDTGKAPTRRFVNGIPIKAFVILGLMVALRSLPQPGSVAFIPRLFEQKGWEPAQYGLITSFFWIASGIAGIVFGQLADRWDRRRIMTISMVLGAPAFFLLPGLDGIPAFVMAVAAGGLTGGSHSIIVVLAQELIPASRGLASGTILGFIFGTGALSSLVIGALSDAIELGPTFQVMAVVSVIAGLLALALPPRPAQTALLEEREAVPAQI